MTESSWVRADAEHGKKKKGGTLIKNPITLLPLFIYRVAIANGLGGSETRHWGLIILKWTLGLYCICILLNRQIKTPYLLGSFTLLDETSSGWNCHFWMYTLKLEVHQVGREGRHQVFV